MTPCSPSNRTSQQAVRVQASAKHTSKFIALGKAGSIGGTGTPAPEPTPGPRDGCAGHHAQLRQFPLLSFLHGADHGHQNNVGEVAREPCERAEGPTRGVTRTTGACGTITTCAASAGWATMTERLKPVSAMAAGITAAITSFLVFIETPGCIPLTKPVG